MECCRLSILIFILSLHSYLSLFLKHDKILDPPICIYLHSKATMAFKTLHFDTYTSFEGVLFLKIFAKHAIIH